MDNVIKLRQGTSSTSESRLLSDAEAGRAKPRQHRYFIRDTQHTGFALLVHPTGSKVWVTEQRVKGTGKVRRVTHGKTSALNYQKALKLHLDVVGKLAEGIDVTEQRRKDRATQVTWEQVLKGYIADKTAAGKLRLSTVRLYGKLLAGAAGPLAKLSVSATSRERVKRWYLGLAEHPAQANQALRLLKSLWGYGVAVGMLPEATPDPTVVISKGGIKYADKVRENQLPPERFGELAAAILMLHGRGDFSRTTRDALLLLMLTGWRRENVLQLKHQQVDLAQGIINLDQTKTTPQLVPLTSVTSALVKSCRDNGSVYVFPSPRAKEDVDIPLRNPHPALKLVSRELGLDWDITPQSLRASFSTLLGYLGVPQFMVKALIGHSVGNDVTLKHYQRLHIQPLRESLQMAHDYVSRSMPVEGEVELDSRALQFMAFGHAEGVQSLDDVVIPR